MRDGDFEIILNNRCCSLYKNANNLYNFDLKKREYRCTNSIKFKVLFLMKSKYILSSPISKVTNSLIEVVRTGWSR